MASFTVVVPPKFKPVVARGDLLKPGQILAKVVSDKKSGAGAIALHKLLEVKPKDVEKFMVKAEGDAVAKGEVIAQKRGLFTSIKVKSPLDGVLLVSTKGDGFVRIKPASYETITSPVGGTVRNATEKVGIIIDTQETIITGEAGEGDASGNLFEVAGDGNIFNIDKKVDGKIVVGDHFGPASAAKIKTLGGNGLVLTDTLKTDTLPYLVVKDIARLDEYIGKKVKIINKKHTHFLMVV